MGTREFIKQAFSDTGQPSSSRLLTAATTLSSIVALLVVVFKTGHMPDGMSLTGLGAFGSSPYPVNRASAMFSYQKKDIDIDTSTTHVDPTVPNLGTTVPVSGTLVVKKKDS